VEKTETKRKIARQLGVEEVYEPNMFVAINQGEEAANAHRKVERRYDELVEKGRIQEAIAEEAAGENVYDQINARLEEGFSACEEDER